MYWQVIHNDSLADADRSSCLMPWADASPSVCLAVQKDRLSLLSGLPAKGPFPLGVLDTAEWASESGWRDILRFFPAHRLDLARYCAAHPEVPSEALIAVLGMRSHYKNLADWKEMGALDDDVIAFGKENDFAIDVLRLFERFGQADRNAWRSIWTLRGVRRNLIRDMILDYYDLDMETRALVLYQCTGFARDWAGRSGVFPAEELREMVRTRRYPLMTQAKKQVAQLRKELHLPKGTSIDIPQDMENHGLEARIVFRSGEEFTRALDHLKQNQTVQGIERILDML